ncbi:hypothetical protein DNTS_018942 [Danionella cerebrum]|uniref:Uncharacterized protein n=1 Tax=Danionella cerebrum TaxID=2873325 RepID=A0A553RAD2_9TELE|nr:hypothetical protein DNTS_018942 [Danionella translucida]
MQRLGLLTLFAVGNPVESYSQLVQDSGITHKLMQEIRACSISLREEDEMKADEERKRRTDETIKIQEGNGIKSIQL